MIRTESIYKPIDGKDRVRIEITLSYPRGVKREKYDVQIRSLVPSADLLKR